MSEHRWWPIRRRHKPDANRNGYHPAQAGQHDLRMATDLGDALTAYCRTGAWWGPLGFADWLVKTGQLAEARYILQVLAETEISPKGLIRLRRVERKLAQELTASARPTADLAGGQANGFAPP